ncbi:MAG: outer membrane protein assembly factor BamD [Nitrospinae bacterium]|nr:outer membrane protein assembly factor BamD [Nitrospinota bacterium]
MKAIMNPATLFFNWLNLIILSLMIGIFGCATTKKEKISADKLLIIANSDIKKKRYEKAQKNFERLLEDYPDSIYKIDALMGLADSIYKQKMYEEARFQYQKFTELYPMHSDVDKAHFNMGTCSFKEIESLDRDQTNTDMALEKFEKIISDYPNSLYYKEAVENIKFCKKRLAENLLYIGRFYFRIGAYQATINRMQDLLSKYPDQGFGDQAIYYLGESYIREGNLEKAKESFQILISDYPKSKYVSYAKKIVTINN